MYEPRTGRTAAKINREKIESYLEKNPDATGVEIIKNLGLSGPTVYKHLAAIVKDHKKKKA
jgi:DNA-binding CsgD family transcriptional regulator